MDTNRIPPAERRAWTKSIRKRCAKYFSILIDKELYAFYKQVEYNPYNYHRVEDKKWSWKVLAYNGSYDPAKAIIVVEFLNKHDTFGELAPKQMVKHILAGMETDVKT